MKKIITSILLIFSLSFLSLSPCSQAAEKLRVIVPPDEHPEFEHIQYFYALLNLVLSKTVETDGEFEVVVYPEVINYERYLQGVKTGLMDVIWTNTDDTRERELLPIHISILKDLNSYRIFFIRKEDQAKFDAIKSLDDLRQLKCGQGSTWPDTIVLRNNGLQVVTAIRQDSLLKMLVSKRFDFFPRGLYEIWREEAANTDKNIAIEKNLMFYYPSPVYFFVNKNNKKLASRIERGLKIAINDGSFDQLFFSVTNFKRGYEEQMNSKRTLLKLDTSFRQSVDKD